MGQLPDGREHPPHYLFHLLDWDLKGVAIELPFFLLNLIIVYLGYPLKS